MRRMAGKRQVKQTLDDVQVADLQLASSESESGRKNKKKRKTKDDRRSFNNVPFLLGFKPRERYVFHSDYYQVDDRWCSILSFFHTEGATDNFAPFWGVNRIPSGLDNDIQVILFEQNRRMTEGWLSEHQNTSENLAERDEHEQAHAGSNAGKLNATRKAADLMEIAHDLQNGAAYLNIQFRLLVSAPSLEKLDAAITKITQQYIDRFPTCTSAAYFGEQRNELARLFAKNEAKQGHGFFMTSTEYAGAYSLVTHGVEDSDGEYVGYMMGDVNNAAVLFNTNGYRQRVIIADEGYEAKLDRSHATALWGSKLSQSCLLSNGRCVHLILDGTELDKLGPAFRKLTYRVDLNKGDVNMFEMFGQRKDQLSIFPSQMQKLILMAEQAYNTTDSDRSIIRGSLEEIATHFYIQQHMWFENAKENQEKLRIVGIPHKEVPKLELFCSYLDMEYSAMVNKTARDDEKLHALSVLRVTFRNLLSNNGDLFNTITSDSIDGAAVGSRVIYDFSRLLQRGTGVAMAQLVNIIGFAVSNMGAGDTVFIHGAEKIDSSVKDYLSVQLEKLFDAGGRCVFLYNSIDKMLEDKEFCNYDKADYTIFGTMTEGQVHAYQDSVSQEIPADLVRLVTNKSEEVSYIRRGFDNIVFKRDLILGSPMEKERGYRW